MFEYIITHERTYRYNLICSIVAHDKKTYYKYDEIIIGDRLIPKHVTTEAFKALDNTFNFIDIWQKLSEENYDARRVAYSTAMK